MSQLSEHYYDYSNVDWDEALNPTPKAMNERAVEVAVKEDLLNFVDGVSRGRKPEELFAETNLARATGMPLSAVMNDKESAMAVAYQNALAGKIDETMPYIRGEKKIATDMFDILPAGESAAIVTDRPLWEMGKIQRGFGSNIFRRWEMGDLQQEYRELLWDDILGMSTPESNRRINILAAYEGINQEERESEGLLTGMWNSTIEYAPQFRDMGIATVKGSATGMVMGAGIGATVGTTVGTVVPGAGNVAGGLAGAASGATTGALLGGKLGVAYFSYKRSVAEIWGSIRDYKDEYGNTIDPTTARMIAFLGGIPMAGLDLVSVGKFMEFVPGLDRFVNQSAVQATTEFIKKNPGILQHVGESARKGLTAFGTEMVTEGMQEGIVVAAEEIAKNTGNLDMPATTMEEALERMVDAAKEAGKTFAIPTAAGIGGRAFINRKIQQSQGGTKTLKELHKVAKESETLRHVPEIAQDFQKRLGEEGGLQEIYVKPEAIQRVFFQSEEGIAQAATLGITPEILAESLALETDIAIPMDLAVAHVLNNENVFNELAPDMKIEVDALTAREADALAAGDESVSSQVEQESNAFLDYIFDGLEEEIAENKRRSDMAAPYVEQLVSAGYTERQAEHLATLPIAHAEVMAPMFNQTAEEYLSQRFGGFIQTTAAMLDKTEKVADKKAIVDSIEGNFFYQGKKHARGAIDFNNPQAVVYLFKGKNNLSTVIHESGHFFLNNLSEAAQLENAPVWVKESWGALQQEYDFKGFAIPEEAHERFAREFEAYAREGKAPSSYLEAAFRQFSNWLVRLYRSIRSLIGADEISPDIRNVFDHLLATEQEIKEARAQESMSVSLEAMEKSGLAVNPELKNRYAQAVAEAHQRAESAVMAKRLVEQRKMEKIFKQDAESKILRNPFYIGEASVRQQGGIRWDSVLEHIDEGLAEELRRKWTVPFAKGLFKENGVLDFADVAMQFNEDSPHGFAGLLLAMPTRKETIEADVQASLAEWNKSFDASMEYSNAMDEVLALELEALTGKQQPSSTQLRRVLEERTGVKKGAVVEAEYKALKASLHKQNAILKDIMRDVNKEAKALKKEAKQAFQDGVVAGEMHEGAKRAKERSQWQQRLAEAKAQERAKRIALSIAYKARIERDKIIRQIRREVASKSVHDAYKQQILALVGHWRRLGTPTMVARDIENIVPLREFITQQESLFGETESLFPDWILDEGNTPGEKALGDLSLEEMRELQKAIRILAHHGRSYDKFLSFGKSVQLTEAAGEMIASMDKSIGKKYLSEQDRATFQGKVTGMLRGMTSEITAMRYVFDALDGYVNKGGKDSQVGPGHKYIISQFQQAQDKENKILREFDAKLSTCLQKLARPDMKKAFVIEGIPLPDDVAREWGGMFTHEKVIAVALNMGNEGNIKALKRGFGWSDADLQTITSRLTAQELQTIQEVWNILDELYPLLNETHQTMNGVPLTKVSPEAVTFHGVEGGVELAGGYYPLVFDHNLSRKAQEFQNADELINRNENILRSAKPKSGMTKERKGGTLPPRLSLSVIQRHVVDSIHYATHAPVLHDIYRITKMPEYRNAFVRAAGLEAYNELTPWLRYIARPEGEQVTRIDRAIEWMAKRGTLYVLAFNMKSAFLQLASMGNSIVEVGGVPFMKGAYQLLKRPHKVFNEVKAKSAYMESRSRLLDASLREWLDQFRLDGAKGVRFMGKTFTLEQVRNAQFAFIQGLDAIVAYPTWIAAYNTAIASGMSEVEAVQRSNEAVIRAQGSGGYIDVTKIQRRRGIMKAFTVFTTFALNDFNRKKYYTAGVVEYARGGHSAINFKDYAQHLALEWIAPVVFSAMMLSLGRDGELPDAEDYFWEAVGFYLMGIPIVRDVARYAESQFTGQGFGRGIGGSVAFAGLETGVKAVQAGVKAIVDDDEKAQKRFTREFINTMGFMSGVGTPQLWRSMDGFEAYFVDDEGGVLAPFLGKPQKK